MAFGKITIAADEMAVLSHMRQSGVRGVGTCGAQAQAFAKRLLDQYAGVLHYQFDAAALVFLAQAEADRERDQERTQMFSVTCSLLSYCIRNIRYETPLAAGSVGWILYRQILPLVQQSLARLRILSPAAGRELGRDYREFQRLASGGSGQALEEAAWQERKARLLDRMEKRVPRDFFHGQAAAGKGIRPTVRAPLSMSQSFFKNLHHCIRENRMMDFRQLWKWQNLRQLKRYEMERDFQEILHEADTQKREARFLSFVKDYGARDVRAYLEAAFHGQAAGSALAVADGSDSGALRMLAPKTEAAQETITGRRELALKKLELAAWRAASEHYRKEQNPLIQKTYAEQVANLLKEGRLESRRQTSGQIKPGQDFINQAVLEDYEAAEKEIRRILHTADDMTRNLLTEKTEEYKTLFLEWIQKETAETKITGTEKKSALLSRADDPEIFSDEEIRLLLHEPNRQDLTVDSAEGHFPSDESKQETALQPEQAKQRELALKKLELTAWREVAESYLEEQSPLIQRTYAEQIVNLLKEGVSESGRHMSGQDITGSHTIGSGESESNVLERHISGQDFIKQTVLEDYEAAETEIRRILQTADDVTKNLLTEKTEEYKTLFLEWIQKEAAETEITGTEKNSAPLSQTDDPEIFSDEEIRLLLHEPNHQDLPAGSVESHFSSDESRQELALQPRQETALQPEQAKQRELALKKLELTAWREVAESYLEEQSPLIQRTYAEQIVNLLKESVSESGRHTSGQDITGSHTIGSGEAESNVLERHMPEQDITGPRTIGHGESESNMLERHMSGQIRLGQDFIKQAVLEDYEAAEKEIRRILQTADDVTKNLLTEKTEEYKTLFLEWTQKEAAETKITGTEKNPALLFPTDDPEIFSDEEIRLLLHEPNRQDVPAGSVESHFPSDESRQETALQPRQETALQPEQAKQRELALKKLELTAWREVAESYLEEQSPLIQKTYAEQIVNLLKEGVSESGRHTTGQDITGSRTIGSGEAESNVLEWHTPEQDITGPHTIERDESESNMPKPYTSGQIRLGQDFIKQAVLEDYEAAKKEIRRILQAADDVTKNLLTEKAEEYKTLFLEWIQKEAAETKITETEENPALLSITDIPEMFSDEELQLLLPARKYPVPPVNPDENYRPSDSTDLHMARQREIAFQPGDRLQPVIHPETVRQPVIYPETVRQPVSPQEPAAWREMAGRYLAESEEQSPQIRETYTEWAMQVLLRRQEEPAHGGERGAPLSGNRYADFTRPPAAAQAMSGSGQLVLLEKPVSPASEKEAESADHRPEEQEQKRLLRRLEEDLLGYRNELRLKSRQLQEVEEKLTGQQRELERMHEYHKTVAGQVKTASDRSRMMEQLKEELLLERMRSGLD